MSASTINEIHALAKNVDDILRQKYEIDVFQREYMWKREHMEDLITDLVSKFQYAYDDSHERHKVASYPSYYLGSIILSMKEGVRYIIDGQQRLTSLTLLLIYLNNLQKIRSDQVNISGLILSEKFSIQSYNLQIEDRKDCINALYNGEEYDPNGKGDSVKNIVERYNDVQELFPEELKGKALPYFIDWLKEKVIFVEIMAYSDEDAYSIFETMNDRGLSLTSTEMLKGFLLSKIDLPDRRQEMNDLWKKQITRIRNEIDEEGEDLEFFKAWFRAKYAVTIRESKKGASNEDFENISIFHTWVKENTSKIGLDSSKSYYEFIKKNFDFYSNQYLHIFQACQKVVPGLEHIYYIDHAKFANSFYSPLLMAPIEMTDDSSTIIKKLALVARYLETFLVLRYVNNKTLSHSSIRYSMYTLIKEVRGQSTDDLADLLKRKVQAFDEKFLGMDDFRLHQQNKRFVHFLLARMTHYIEEQCGIPSKFEDYANRTKLKKPYQIEHLWSDTFEAHKKEFDQREEFDEYRNRLGALVLIPKGFNQSYSGDSYEDKLDHYRSQNLLANSLHPKCYEKNPSFLRFIKDSNLPFRPHEKFERKDVERRQTLYTKICELIWSVDGFDS